MQIQPNEITALKSQAHPLWHPLMDYWFKQPWWETIWGTVKRCVLQGTLTPIGGRIFRVLSMSPEDVKVIILGQDPYPKAGQAKGLAFSCPDMTPSLRNIFREIALTEGRLRHRTLLDDWHAQGVFLLNVSLTTRVGSSNAHANIGWDNVTSSIIRHLAEHATQPLVIMGWGAFAKKLIATTFKPHGPALILIHTHPAARFNEFTGNNHFKLANDFLQQHGVATIDWAGIESTKAE